MSCSRGWTIVSVVIACCKHYRRAYSAETNHPGELGKSNNSELSLRQVWGYSWADKILGQHLEIKVCGSLSYSLGFWTSSRFTCCLYSVLNVYNHQAAAANWRKRGWNIFPSLYLEKMFLQPLKSKPFLNNFNSMPGIQKPHSKGYWPGTGALSSYTAFSARIISHSSSSWIIIKKKVQYSIWWDLS